MDSTRGQDGLDDVALVASLLREQAPHLSHLPVRRNAAQGSSNVVFRLGDGLAARLPRSREYVADLENETRFLPRVAPFLSVPVPSVVFVGRAGDEFPFPWSVVTWVPGDGPGDLDPVQQAALARTLGEFLRRLHAVGTDGLTGDREPWGYRCGEPVTDEIDGWAELAADRLADLFDPGQVREAWRRLRAVPAASRPPCWVHTDIAAENIPMAL